MLHLIVVFLVKLGDMIELIVIFLYLLTYSPFKKCKKTREIKIILNEYLFSS